MIYIACLLLHIFLLPFAGKRLALHWQGVSPAQSRPVLSMALGRFKNEAAFYARRIRF
jgi:hypothetical protein